MGKQLKSNIVGDMMRGAQIVKAISDALRDRSVGDEYLLRVLREGSDLPGKIADLLMEGEDKPARLILTPTGTVKVKPTEKLIACEFFTKENPSVAISYLSESFINWFLGKTEVRVKGEVNLRYHTLAKPSVDGPIIAELGGETKAETTLAEIVELMMMQAHRKSDALLANGYANIFYVRNAVGVCAPWSWLGSAAGWYVDANSVAYPDGWRAGHRVFSRDS